MTSMCLLLTTQVKISLMRVHNYLYLQIYNLQITDLPIVKLSKFEISDFLLDFYYRKLIGAMLTVTYLDTFDMKIIISPITNSLIV